MYTIITNNCLVRDKYSSGLSNLKVEYLENGTCLEVLVKVRDFLHKGRRLETHPMSGSVKPNQNPYKTVIISDDKTDAEELKEFVTVIENGIITFQNFLRDRPLPDWSDALREDFKIVDLSLIESAVCRLR